MGYGGIVRGREKEMQEREEAAKCPPCSQNAHDEAVLVRCAQSRTHLPTPVNGRWGGERRKRKEEKSLDSLCSRNARPEKALVGRAQQKINQPPPLRENERAWTGKLDR